MKLKNRFEIGQQVWYSWHQQIISNSDFFTHNGEYLDSSKISMIQYDVEMDFFRYKLENGRVINEISLYESIEDLYKEEVENNDIR